MWSQMAWVAMGGAAGALARFALTRALPPLFGTLAVNVAGCFAFGLLLGLFADMPDRLRLAGMVGFLGSFTTFSTYGAETVLLGGSGALANILAHNVLGLAAVFVGLSLASIAGR